MNGYTVEPPFDRIGWEDYELLIRYALRGWRGLKASQPLMAYRTHAGSMIDRMLRKGKDAVLHHAIRDRFPELYRSD